jgi:hypothetical protein
VYTPRLVTLPPGAVRLHDARLDKRIDLELQAFAIADAPVTQAEYAAVLGRNAAVRAVAIPTTPGPHRCEPADAALPDTPVHGVTWFDAIDWCNAASDQAGLRRAYRVDGSFVDWDVDADGYRLPTEAEWEYACRAATDGPTYGPLGEIAWTEADDVDEPPPGRGQGARGRGAARRRRASAGARQGAERLRAVRHPRERLGMVLGLRRPREIPRLPRASRRGGLPQGGGGGGGPPPPGAPAPDTTFEDLGFRVAQGAVAGGAQVQGWSASDDRRRAGIGGSLPMGWTPYRELLER